MPSGCGPTSATPSTGVERKQDGSSNDAILTRSTSHDPTSYVQRARVTRAAPPKPACNPLQFVQIKPCNLYQSAQEQVKRAEEVKKVMEVKKEEPEDWQSNLDNWKSCRRKRVEHIIDRVVEVKKLEMEEHDRTRRKSKTFSEMLEERGSKGRKLSLAVYAEDDTNDLSDLGIGTSSASGKSSLSEDFDNHSVISDNQDIEKSNSDVDNSSNHENGNRDYVSSPGYDTSSSTAPASSPDPCEYTYEGAIQDYKSRVSRAQHSGGFNGFSGAYSKDSTPERSVSLDMGKSSLENSFTPKRPAVTKIEDRLINFELKATSHQDDKQSDLSSVKRELPKVDVLRRRELFEKETSPTEKLIINRVTDDFAKTISIKERLSNLEKRDDNKEIGKKQNHLSADFNIVKDRLTNIEHPVNVEILEKPMVIDVPVVALKDRLTSLQSSVIAVEEFSKQEPIKENNLDTTIILDFEPIDHQNESNNTLLSLSPTSDQLIDTDREDSGIHTADVSCSVSQGDEPIEEVAELPLLIEFHEEIKSNKMEEVEFEINIPDVISSTITIDPIEELARSPEPANEQDTSVIEALELAFKAIDAEPLHSSIENNKMTSKTNEPIYENIEEISDLYQELENEELRKTTVEESYYQVPKPLEPYYEVPKAKPVPLYENVEIFYSSSNMKYPVVDKENVSYPIGVPTTLEPPKEKPPPPPVDNSTDDEGGNEEYEDDEKPQDAMKRMNSTKRIKKEIRNKRTSFLGIEGSADDDSFLELSVAPPPNMAAFIQEERRLEKQMYIKAGLYDSSDTTDSRDSGVSENHSRQSSEPLTTSSEEQEDYIVKKEKEFIEHSDKDEHRRSNIEENSSKWDFSDSFRNENEIISNRLDEEAKMRCLEDQIREQEQVLRVERELLQFEQEELKRQRENLLVRKNLAKLELEQGSKINIQTNRHSLQDINATTNHYVNVPSHYGIYKVQTDYRQSMPNLQDMSIQEFSNQKRLPPVPPAKPLRSQLNQDFMAARDATVRHSRMPSADANIEVIHNRNHSAPIKMNNSKQNSQQTPEDFVQLRNNSQTNGTQYGNMSRHTLHALSAVPKPKFQDGWVQSRSTDKEMQSGWRRKGDYVNTDTFLNKSYNNKERIGDSWLAMQQKRKSDPQGFNYNKHWLIQEAEQLRIDQQRGVRASTNGWNYSIIQRKGVGDNKPLPDAVIQTLTQRVQSRGIGERKRSENHQKVIINSNLESLAVDQHNIPETPKEILSVSGKKKCSYCGEELGRGAAMIIESLRLFYHLDCFKCCVCRVQLGDGVSGADVRVRNQKLHCHNCFSSDDGIKFSCV